MDSLLNLSMTFRVTRMLIDWACDEANRPDVSEDYRVVLRKAIDALRELQGFPEEKKQRTDVEPERTCNGCLQPESVTGDIIFGYCYSCFPKHDHRIDHAMDDGMDLGEALDEAVYRTTL